MDAVAMLKERRSIRKYKDEVVSDEVMDKIIDNARFAPSWANYQIARYHLVSNPDLLKKITERGVGGFAYNIKTLENAKNVAILSFVQGKSGKLDLTKDEYATNKANFWEMFDAGIACQTFCLAAYEQGVGTCIFGVIDDKALAEILDLPKEETVAAIIVYGYPAEVGAAPSRKSVEEISRKYK